MCLTKDYLIYLIWCCCATPSHVTVLVRLHQHKVNQSCCMVWFCRFLVCPIHSHSTSKNELYLVLRYVNVYTKNTQVGHLTYLRRHTKKGTRSYVIFASYFRTKSYVNFASYFGTKSYVNFASYMGQHRMLISLVNWRHRRTLICVQVW